MNKASFVLGLVSAVVLGSIIGCATTGGATPPAPVAPSPQTAVANPDAETPPNDPLRVGFTRGAMSDPQAHEWQADLLRAIGREGQYFLFDYIFTDGSADPQVYVGIQFKQLKLTPEELGTAASVQARYEGTAVGATTRDGLWMANAWNDRSGKVASAN